jgi:cytochrome c oxidase subunit 2
MPVTGRRRLLRFAPAIVCACLGGCAQQPATTQAEATHTLYYIILSLAAVVFIGVEGILLWCIVRYRARKGDTTEPPQRYGSTRVLVLFFLIGAVLVTVLFPFGEITLARVDANPTPIETIDVQGSQWQWSAVYKNEGVVVSGKSFVRPLVMEVPIDEPIRINLVSNDVMHEFFVPAFFFMRNAMPGHPNDFTWTPTRFGTFDGQCAEFCGLGHYQMRFEVKVVAQTDFLAWVKSERQSILSLNCSPAAGNKVQLTAHNISWDTNCLAVAAGQTASLTVANLDEGIDHNFAIYDGLDLKHELFVIPQFAGVATKSFTIPTIAPGKYYFQCNVHGPAMSGVFIVKKGGG